MAKSQCGYYDGWYPWDNRVPKKPTEMTEAELEAQQWCDWQEAAHPTVPQSTFEKSDIERIIEKRLMGIDIGEMIQQTMESLDVESQFTPIKSPCSSDG